MVMGEAVTGRSGHWDATHPPPESSRGREPPPNTPNPAGPVRDWAADSWEVRSCPSDQVAELLQLRPQTVRDAAWRGKLPCVRLWRGKKKTLLRFRRADIERLINARTQPVKEPASTSPRQTRS